MKKITNKVLWIFAVGQFGWSLLAGIISAWLTFYFTGEGTVESPDQGIFAGNITQGTLILGLTLFGIITAVGRIFDAVTDPLIASWSDRSNFRGGRRIPFMKIIALPFSLAVVGIFLVPQTGNVIINDILIFALIIIYYLFMTVYCTPYNALISELGDTQKNRINVSTYISLTYIVGFSVAQLVPNLANVFSGIGKENAIRLAIAVMAAIAAIAMLIPSLLIKEREYIDSKPVNMPAFKSLFSTYKNRQFRRFVVSDIIYFFAITIFQTGLPFYETKLMGISESMTFTFTVIMTVVSLALYVPVNRLAPKLGKKLLIIVGFFTYAGVFLLASLCGKGEIWGYLVAVLAGLPMAILGILPQACVADVAELDRLQRGEDRSGMFFAARTFAFKMGQALAMLVFTSVVVSKTEMSYRVTAIIATVACLIGAICFLMYNERDIMRTIDGLKVKSENKDEITE